MNATRNAATSTPSTTPSRRELAVYGAIALGPDWGEVAAGLTVPRIPDAGGDGRSWTLALIGGIDPFRHWVGGMALIPIASSSRHGDVRAERLTVPPPSGSLRATRSMAWMPLVPS